MKQNPTRGVKVSDHFNLLTMEEADPSARDRDLWTPLHYVAVYDGTDPARIKKAIRTLLAKGADPFAEDIYGNTPLIYAIDRPDSNSEFADMLFEAQLQRSKQSLGAFAAQTKRLAEVSCPEIHGYLLEKLKPLMENPVRPAESQQLARPAVAL